MSTDYSYAGVRTKSAGNSKRIEKGLKRLLVIAAIIFAAELIWLFGISPFIPFSTVEVHGFTELDRETILILAGVDDASSFASANVKEIQEKLSSHILVESALVMKRFPDKLSIFLTPRKAVASALTFAGSRQVPMYVDRQGVFFKVGNVNSQETAALPIISGLENPRLNMRLPSALVPLPESLSVIAASSPELLAAISEIRIERKVWEGYELVLYPVHSSIKVRVENNLTEDMLRYILLMLNVFEASSPKPAEIDFRSGIGSYRVKEQYL